LFDQTIDPHCTQVALRAKSIEIQHLAFQELLLRALVSLATVTDSTVLGKLRELQPELILLTKELVREAAAFEDISYAEETKILKASIANLDFLFEEIQTRLRKLYSTNSCSPDGG